MVPPPKATMGNLTGPQPAISPPEATASVSSLTRLANGNGQIISKSATPKSPLPPWASSPQAASPPPSAKQPPPTPSTNSATANSNNFPPTPYSKPLQQPPPRTPFTAPRKSTTQAPPASLLVAPMPPTLSSRRNPNPQSCRRSSQAQAQRLTARSIFSLQAR